MSNATLSADVTAPNAQRLLWAGFLAIHATGIGYAIRGGILATWAAQYGFTPGLRQRIPTDMPAPSYYEPATGRIAGLDITLFVDAQLSANEVLATRMSTLRTTAPPRTRSTRASDKAPSRRSSNTR